MHNRKELTYLVGSFFVFVRSLWYLLDKNDVEGYPNEN